MFFFARSSQSRIDKDGSLSVDWKEWRNFFQLYPSGDLEDMVQYWRQSLVSNNMKNVRHDRYSHLSRSTCVALLPWLPLDIAIIYIISTRYMALTW